MLSTVFSERIYYFHLESIAGSPGVAQIRAKQRNHPHPQLMAMEIKNVNTVILVPIDTPQRFSQINQNYMNKKFGILVAIPPST